MRESARAARSLARVADADADADRTAVIGESKASLASATGSSAPTQYSGGSASGGGSATIFLRSRLGDNATIDGSSGGSSDGGTLPPAKAPHQRELDSTSVSLEFKQRLNTTGYSEEASFGDYVFAVQSI